MGEREIFDPKRVSIDTNLNSMGSSVIYYKMVDSSHYSFTYETFDGIGINMTESDRDRKSTEFVDAEFEGDLPESDKACYIAAAMSGMLTGIMRNCGIADAFEELVERFKNEKDWKKYVVSLANMLGYMKSDYDGAVKYLADMAVKAVRKESDEGIFEQVYKCLTNLSAHPTVVGLIFSITTQFSGLEYRIIENKVQKTDIPDYYAVGRNYHEKVVYGFLYWVFDLAVNVAFSKRNILDNLTMPKQLTDLIKAFLDTDLMRKVPQNYEEAIIAYSEWIKKLFENSEVNEADGTTKVFDLEECINVEMKGFHQDMMPIVLNECVVRGFYFIHKLTYEIKRNNISHIYDLNKISVENILPLNNRTISHMCLIASSTYVAINAGRIVIEYIKGKKTGDRNFKDVLLETLDFPGVFRLCIAVAVDSTYWKDDFEIIFEKIRNTSNKENMEDATEQSVVDEEDEVLDEEIFERFTLDALQARLLYSFEAIYVQKDIERTKNSKDRLLKQKWFDLWSTRILIGQSAACEDVEYFVTDENILYEGLFELSKDKNNLSWLYLMGTDLVLFEPYHSLGVKDDKSFKKLKVEYNYINDQFVRRQTVVSQQEVDAYLEKYKKYYDSLSGNKVRLATKIGFAAAVSAATGGLALAFAPSIAVALAGEAVVGLHGAALTSASLAFVGGGSLAAGGLGMSGGTAIIAGGGAILGLASSTGTVSVASMLNQMDENSITRMAAKLSAFCDVVIKGIFKDDTTIQNLISAIDRIIEKSQNELVELKTEDNDLDKGLIEKLKNYIKDMEKLKRALGKLVLPDT